MLNVHGLLAIFILYSPKVESEVKIENNGYKGIVIAINPEIEENPDLIDALKSAWTDASQDLYLATQKRAFFEEVTILVPKNWKSGIYSQSEDETYKEAAIVVANPNPVYNDAPYTVQYGLCGEPGSYIHLTPNYLLNDEFTDDYGPRGKTIVREWAHYRWGVFDEVVTQSHDPFYLSTTGKVEANRCSLMIKGDNFVVNWNDGTYRKCNKDDQTMLPEDGCVFVPDQSASPSAQASMMSYQYLDSVYTFCHDNTSDPGNLHNKEAPNEHNRLCNLRSTWDVISNNADFYENANPSNEYISTTVPIFNVVQPKSYERYVLVLDTSTSMAGNRMVMMRQAASAFLQSVPQDSEVGMVQFSSYATTISYLIEINTYSERQYLINLLPTVAYGGTSIGSGILQGINVLEYGGGSANGGILIVLSDGQENTAPTLNDAYDQIMHSGVIVDAIVFTAQADPMLQVIAEDTGGIWYFADENNASTAFALTNAFVTSAQVNDGDVYRKTFEIYSTSFELVPSDQQNGHIVVDSTVGNNTIFTFAWSQYNTSLDVVLTTPSRCNYATHSTFFTCDQSYAPVVNYDLQTVQFPIVGTAETGTWNYYIYPQSYYSQNIIVTATSMASNRSIPPIIVESWMGQVEVSDGEAVVVYAQVSIGYAPVIQANVTATIERPTGDLVTITLKDQGAAPDIRKNDGIYSRYFTQYNGPGRYSVQISVTGVDGQTSSAHINSSSKASYRVGDNNGGTLTLNPNGAPPDVAQQYNTGNFARYTSAGGFSYNGTSHNDTFPPSRIIDLVAVQRDVTQENRGILISFTAPGDDYDYGTATIYDIRYTYGASTELVNNFDECKIVVSSDMTSCCYNAPQEAGAEETFSFILEDMPYNASGVPVSIALRAIDDVENKGEVSNVAVMIYFIEPLVPNESEDTNTGSDAYMALMIVFICISAALSIVLAWKFLQDKKKREENQTRESVGEGVENIYATACA